MKLSLLMAAISSSFLVACGGGSDSTISDVSSSDTTLSTGIFVDSAVSGIDYKTATREGTTNERGEFKYLDGEEITFSIGDLVFPSATAKDKITPLDLAGTTEIDDPKVVNMVRLLLSLDQDDNPNNGISITNTAKSSATVVDFAKPTAEFASDAIELIKNGGQDISRDELVTVNYAQTHFQETINDITTDNAVGMFKLTDGEQDYEGIINLYPDGTYLLVEYNKNIESTVDQGFEFGKLHLSNGVFNPVMILDKNGTDGLSHGAFTDVVITNTQISMTKTEQPDEVYTIVTDRVLFDDPIQGSWTSKGGEMSFNFLPNGSYYLVQVTDLEEVENGGLDDEDIGIEVGTYTYENGLLDLSRPIVETSAGSLLQDDDAQKSLIKFTTSQVSADGNTLTLTVDFDGTLEIVTFTRNGSLSQNIKFEAE